MLKTTANFGQVNADLWLHLIYYFQLTRHSRCFPTGRNSPMSSRFGWQICSLTLHVQESLNSCSQAPVKQESKVCISANSPLKYIMVLSKCLINYFVKLEFTFEIFNLHHKFFCFFLTCFANNFSSKNINLRRYQFVFYFYINRRRFP